MILVAFRYGDSRLFSRLVTAVRGGDSAHCEIAIPEPDDHLSLCISASFLDDGVRGKIINVTDPGKWRVYRWDHRHQDPVQWLRTNYGSSYDVRGLLGILSSRIGHSKGKRFCSEAVAEMLNLRDPHTYDLVKLETTVRIQAPRVMWSDGSWVDARQIP